MNLFKTSILSGIATIIKISSSLVINKILAVTVGPSGIAIIGQFQNVFSMITTIGSGATATGITKYVAEHAQDKHKRSQFINAALVLAVICSIVSGLLMLFAQQYFSQYIFYSLDFTHIFVLLSMTIIFGSLNIILLAILNGLKKIKLFIFSNIIGSLLSLVISTILTLRFQLHGALISLIINQVVIFIVIVYLYRKYDELRAIFTRVRPSKDTYFSLLKYSLMAIVSIIALPTTQILIRNEIAQQISLDAAGLWQGVIKISDMYLMVITMAFSTYYLPRLSEIKETGELREEIYKSYKVILPITLLGALTIYLLRDVIIKLLFSAQFSAMESLFFYQLLGDVFKMASWILGYLLIARAMSKTYIIIEILFSASLYFFSLLFVKLFGLQGANIAFALNYFVYLCVLVYLFRNLLFQSNKDFQSDL